MAWVITVRSGRVTRHRGYRTREEALDAVGLSEYVMALGLRVNP